MRKTVLFLPLLLMLLLLCACENPAASASAGLGATPAVTSTPQIAIIHTFMPAPGPTDTPEPTPTPTPVPQPTDYIGTDAWSNLLMDVETIRLVAFSSSAKLYQSPSPLASADVLKNTVTDSRRSELIVLGEETAADGTLYYHVQTAYGDGTGYVKASATRDSRLAEDGVSGYALMSVPGATFFESWDETGEVLAQESYRLVRVLGSAREFWYVRSETGQVGYMNPAQLQPLTREQAQAYLRSGAVAHREESYSTAHMLAYAETLAGSGAADGAQFILELLTHEGLYFSAGYYRYFEKPLSDKTVYPHFYTEAVYNSLLFKLYNSAGDLVQYHGAETEWAYIGDAGAIEAGDLLFFSAYDDPDDATVEKYEVVFMGLHSGCITDCGLYLGDGRMLTVRDGTVTVIENLQATALFAYFDAARRISPTVTDARAHLIEVLIASAYDRLGTPYSNVRRTGDWSFDCSGLICWCFRRAGLTRSKTGREQLTETTASGLSNLDQLYRDGAKVRFALLNDEAKVREDIQRLERGDIVFLLGESRSKIAHVMIYLGDMRVIHSTTVTPTYRGTLIAGFRQELQSLYYLALRITDLE